MSRRFGWFRVTSAALLGLMVLLGVAGTALAQGSTNPRLACTPKSGTDVSQVDSLEDLQSCRQLAQTEEPENGEFVVYLTQPDAPGASRTHVDENIWEGHQVTLPTEDSDADSVYVLQGDVLGRGRCEVVVFEGAVTGPVSSATWQLYLVEGDWMAEAEVMREIAARASQDKQCDLMTEDEFRVAWNKFYGIEPSSPSA